MNSKGVADSRWILFILVFVVYALIRLIGNELLTAFANIQWWEWVLMVTVPALMGFLVWWDFGRKQK